MAVKLVFEKAEMRAEMSRFNARNNAFASAALFSGSKIGMISRHELILSHDFVIKLSWNLENIKASLNSPSSCLHPILTLW